MAYIGTAPTKVVSRQSVVDYRYIATEGQTAFTGADLNNQVLACNPADMDVYLNGVRLDVTDWSATATTLTLAVGATAGDEVTVSVRQTFEVADTYAKTTADDRFVNAAGDTMTGALGIGYDPTDVLLWVNDSSQNLQMRIGSNTAGVSPIVRMQGKSADGTKQRYADLKLDADNSIFTITAPDPYGPDIHAVNIDILGRVTMPYQPAFCVGLNSGNVSAGSYYVFNVVHTNVGNHYNTSTGRFTAPVTGTYCFLFHNILGSGTTADSDAQIRFNGGRRGEVRSGGGTSNWQTATLARVASLTAGDYVQIYADVGVHYGADEYWCEFSGYLIG